MGLIPQNMSNSVALHGLSYIRPRHSEIARRLVLGQTQADICRDLDMSQSRISIIVNSPLFKIELKKLEVARDQATTDVTAQIREAAPDAIEAIQRTMYMGKSERIRLEAAKDILDRAGYGAITKSMNVNVETKVDTTNMQDQELRDLLVNRLQAAVQAGNTQQAMVAEAEAMDVQFDVVNTDPETAVKSASEEQKAKLLHLLQVGK